MIPAAVVYFSDDSAFVQTQSDSLGLLWAEGPVTKVPDATKNNLELGCAVFDAMRRSRTGVERGKGIDESVWQPHFKTLGITNWKKFDRAAQRVTVWTVDEQIEVMLWSPLDSRGGRTGIDESKIYLNSSASATEIGDAVLAVLRSFA